jgi:hypothetical protein
MVVVVVLDCNGMSSGAVVAACDNAVLRERAREPMAA